MYDVYLFNMLFTKFLLLNNHLEIQMYCYISFQKSQEFLRTFIFVPNRSSEQVLESYRRIENYVELSRTDIVIYI